MANGGQIKFGVGFDVDQSGLNKLKESLKEIQKMRLKDLGDTSNFEKAKNDLKDIKKAASDIENALRKSFNADLGITNLSKFNTEINKLNLSKLYTDLSKAGEVGKSAFRTMTNEVLSTNVQIKQAHKLLNSIAITMKNTIQWNLSSNAMNLITRSISESYGYVKRLDSSLNNIRIVSGQSADQMAEFAVQANNAAKALGTQTTSYTDAALIYYQQGLDSEQVEARTNATIKMANVTGDSAEEVSSYMTAIWNNFDDGSQSLEHYADVITALGASTASSSAEISEGLEKFASIGETVGLSYDYATSALATVVANTRQSADTVGTAFKTIFSRLQGLKLGESLEDGTDLNKYSQALDAIGVNIKDQNGELKQMDTILDETAAKWGTLTQDQKMAMAQTVAGTRQYTQLISLLDNWGDMEKNLETAANAEGALQEQQDIYMDSLKAHLEQLAAAKEDFFDSFTNADSLKDLVDVLTVVINLSGDFIDSIGGGGNALMSLGAIATRIFSSQIAEGIQTSINNFSAWKNNIDQIEQKMTALTNFEGANLGDETLDNILAKHQTMQQNSNVMSKEDMNQGYDLMNQYTEVANLRGAWQDSQAAAEEYIQTILGKKISLSDVMFGTQDEEDVQAKINDTKSQISAIREEIGKIKPLNILEDEEMEKAKTNIDNIINSLKYMRDEDNISKKDSDAAGGLIKKLESIQNELKDIDDGSFVSGTLQNDFTKAKLSAEQFLTSIEKDVNETTDVLEKQANGYGDALEKSFQQAEQKVDDFNSKFTSLSKIDFFVNLAGSIGQVTMSIKEAINLIDVWNNEDLSSGEKAEQILMGISFILPNVISSMKLLGDAYNSGMLKTEAELVAERAAIIETAETDTAATATKVANKKAESEAVEGTAKAINESTDAVEERTTAFTTGGQKIVSTIEVESEAIQQQTSLIKEQTRAIEERNAAARGVNNRPQLPAPPQVITENEVLIEGKGTSNYIPKGGPSDYIDVNPEEYEATNKASEVIGVFNEGAEVVENLGEIGKTADEAGKAVKTVEKAGEAVGEIAPKATKSGSAIKTFFGDALKGARGLLAPLTAIGEALGLAGVAATGLGAVLVGGLAGGAYIAYRAMNKENIALKEATEKANESKASYEDLKSSLDNLNSSLDNLESKKDALKDLTYGTTEWKEAVRETNDEVLALIKQFPELAAGMKNVNGVLTLDENTVEEFQTKANQRAAFAQNNALMDEVEKEEAQYSVDTVNAASDLNIDQDAIELAVQTAVDNGIGSFSEIRSEDSREYEILKDALTNAGYSVDQLKDMIAQNNDASGKNTGAIDNLIATYNSNQNNKDQANKTAVSNYMDTHNVDLGENSDQVKALMSKDLEDKTDTKYEDIYEDGFFGRGTEDDIHKEFLKRSKYVSVDDKIGDKAEYTYYDNEGKKQTDILTDEDVAKQVARDKVLEETSKNADDYKKTLEEMGSVGEKQIQRVFDNEGIKASKREIEEMKGMFTSFAGGKGFGDLSKATEEQLEVFKKVLNHMEFGNLITEEQADEWGHESAEDFYDAFNEQIQNRKDSIKEEKNLTSEDAKNNLLTKDEKGNFEAKNVGEAAGSLSDAVNNGYINADNIIDTDEFDKIDKNIDNLTKAFPSLQNAVQIFNDTALATEKPELYAGALEQIQSSMNILDAANFEGIFTAETAESYGLKSLNDINDALDAGIIKQEEYDKIAQGVAENEAKSYGMSSKALKDYTATMEKSLKKNKEFKKSGQDSSETAEQMALQAAKASKSLEDLSSKYQTNAAIIKEGNVETAEYANAMDSMKTAVEGLFGTDLSDNFINDNLEELGRLAEGDMSVLSDLQSKAAEDYVTNMDIKIDPDNPKEDLEKIKSDLVDEIAAFNPGDFEVGASINDQPFIKTLNNMLAAGQMTVADVNKILSKIGFEPKIGYKKVKAHAGYEATMTAPGVPSEVQEKIQSSGVLDSTVEIPYIDTGATVKAAAPSSVGSPSSHSGGGGGGKSGKKKNANIAKRDDKEEAPEKDPARYEDEFNYYFREEKILNKVTDALEKLQDAQNGLHGAELINNLKEQNNQLEDQKKALDGVIEKTKKLSAEYQHKKDDKKTGIQYNDYVKAYNQNNDWDYYQKLMKNKKKLSDGDKDKLKEYQEKYGKKGSNKYKKYAKKAKKDKQLEYAYEAQKAGSYAKAMTTVKKLKPKKKLSKKEEKRLKAAKEVLKDSAAETAFYEASSGEKLSKKEKKAFKTINKYSGKKKLSKKEKSALTRAAKKLGGKVTKVKGKYKVVGGKTAKDIAKFQKSDTFKAEKNAKNYDKYTELKKKKPKDLTKKDKKALKNLEKKFDTKQKKGLKGKTAKAKEKARATKARKNIANAKAFKQAVKGITTSEKNDLSDFGIKFDKDGKMTTKSYEKVTKREYNKMETAKEDLKNGRITEEQYEKIEKRYKTLKELTEKQKEAEDKINEKIKERNKILDQQIENNRAALQEKIDINVNFNNAKKEWNNLKADFEKNGLNSSTPKNLEWSKNNNFISQQSNISADAAASDFDSDKANFNVYKDSAQEALGEFDYYSNGGEKTSNMIYKSKSDALDALKKYQTELNASIKSMMDDYNNANQALLDGISEYQEQLSKIDDGYERINTKLERMSKLNTLINGNGAKGRDNNIEIAKAKQGNAKNQLESAVAESSKMKSLYDKAIQDGNKDAAEQYYAAWQEAEGKVSSSIEAVAEAADELFNQKLNKSIETFYSTLSDNKFTSLGDMKEDWEDSTKNVEEYLDSVTRVYKQQTLMSKVQKSIDSTNNSGHREELEAFYKKENEALKNKQKLTQYDIDLAEKKYNILLKQQALEDAMNNKDSMKMARGADGNWSYQYVADDSKVKEAQQAVSDGWYELYELTNNAYKDNVDQIMSLTEEMESKIREVYANETLSIEQKNEKAKIIEEEYSNWITSLSQQNAQIQNDLNFATVGNLTQAVMINADNLNSLTEQEKEAVQTGIEAFKGGIMEYETEFESTTSKLKEVGKEAIESTRTDINTGIQQMIDKIAGPDGEATFKGAINAMGESIKTAMTDYANSINEAYGKTDTTLKNMSSDLTTLTGDSDKLKAKTTEICTAMGNDYDKLGGKLKILREQLSGTYKDAEALNSRILQLSQNEVNETNNAPSHLGMPLVQGDNKLEVGDNVVVKAGAWRYKGDKKGDLLKKDDRAWARKHSKSTKDVAYQLKGSHCDLTITKVKGNWAKIKDGKGGVKDGSWIHKKHLVGFDTGGYTGDWGNTDGKLALLHQKEIVLNKADTSNMLEIVKVVRGLVEGGGFINTLKDSIAQSIAQLSASAVSSSFGGITNNSTDNSTNSNQNITLYADFPNANDVSEIKEALLSLPNLAAQYISQK